jgi:hypothetical protein
MKTKNLHTFFFVSLLIAVCCFFPSHSSAQKIRGAFILGANLAQVDGDEVYGYKKWGWNIGPSAMLPLGKNFSLQLETLFSQKGAYQKYSNQYGDSTPYYNLRLNYLEVPVLLTYNDRDIFTAGSGFAWARLSDITEVEHGKAISWTNKRGDYYRDDLLWIVDLRFRTYKRLHFNVRYSYSLSPIRFRTYSPPTGVSWDRKQYNNLLSFRMIWIFNEKLPLDKEKKSGGKSRFQNT